ncbi:aldehyde dehydrogenase [Phenylobacterium montanum]|uniref:Aldehyde dehydrogenase n=1 Tax=Phenylobacterium montanum TaxID=2823693 RepID=A0A975G0D2_9CAUL|nr:aldehyde dehydrogenase [Caulobacter sp. S6]QUD88208.1 aldehyde dehydrogenase [Caulobacter sp. S6]
MLLNTTLRDLERRAAALSLPNQAVIDGACVDALSGATFDNPGPRDGKLLNQVAACDGADVDRAVAAARRAFEDERWRGQGPRAKKAVLHRLADLMAAHADELALLESLDTGKPLHDAANVDIPLAIGTTRYYAEALDKVYGEVGPSPADRISMAVHEPLGVIGAIVPWNFPLHMAMWKVAPALAMGNSVVLKPAEQSPMTAIRLGELALEAGLPAGVLNVVPGLGAVAGQAIGRHMDVDMVAFTGSGPVGRQLMVYAGESNLKRVSLELGGKSPQIVFADCPDFEAAAQAAAWGVFYNQGEVCTAASRLLVQKDVKDAFVARVVEIAAGIAVGDPLDPETRFGAMISERQMATALRYIATAEAEGGELKIGGGRTRLETGGYYVQPTIFDGLNPGSTLAREEVFGPVLGVLSFDTPDQAIALANDTVFGLAAGLWTSDLSLGHKAAKKLRAGLVWVNGWDACDITMPFGGFKQSGFGRDRSLHALHKYADLKAISITLR